MTIALQVDQQRAEGYLGASEAAAALGLGNIVITLKTQSDVK